MKGLRLVKGMAVSLACVGMVFPQMNAFAAAPERPAKPVVRPASAMTDVALGAGGVLSGRIVDAQGQPLDGAVVSLKQGSRDVARTVADAQGRFVFRGLKGGAYVIEAGQSRGAYRLWAPQTAPPKAQQQALLVAGGPVVRGQFGGLDIITLTLLGSSIGALVLSAVNQSDINDVESKVDDAIDAINALSP